MSQQQHDAIKAIMVERAYQDGRWAGTGHHETGGYLAFIQHYLTRAMDELTHEHNRAALSSVRKIAALAVACMEDNGIVER